MVIEITDCASRGKVYHNVKLLDGRRADVAAGLESAIVTCLGTAHEVAS